MPCSAGKKAAAKDAAEKRLAEGRGNEEDDDDDDEADAEPGGSNPFAALVELKDAVNAPVFVPHK